MADGEEPEEGDYHTFDRPDISALQVPDYCYRAQLVEVVDGDTFDVRIDLGFETHALERVRAMDIDTSEISFVSHDSEEYEEGMEHTEFLESWASHAEANHDGEWPLVIYSAEYDRGAYGRVLGDIYSIPDDEWYTEAIYNAEEGVELFG